MHTYIQNDKYLSTHVVLEDVAFFNIQFVDQFRVQFWRIKMQLINIHLAEKGPLVVKFAKH